MKVVTLLASPRTKGNSATLANIFNETAEALGAEVLTFTLNKLTFRGCQACESCKTKLDRCAIDDDLSTVLESVKNTDILVLATPVYFADISSQLKTFVDRCYSYFEPFGQGETPDQSRLNPGKRAVIILTQGQPNEDMYSDIYIRYDLIFQVIGFTNNRLIRGCDLMRSDDIRKKRRDDLIDLAKETAKEMIK